MEQLSYDITTEVGKLTKTRVIANRGGKKFLLLFFVSALFQGMFSAKNYDVIHIGDPVLSFIGWAIKKIIKKPATMEVHGLDVLYPSKIYQWYLRAFFPSADLVICISRYAETLVKQNFPNAKTTIINPGVKDVFYDPSLKRTELTDKKILLTVGRLVKRKGVAWFIANVLPLLPENVVYLIVGSGAEKINIENAIKMTKQQNKAVLFENVSTEKIKQLYNTADLFIMPNIKVENDAEGFGLVAVEAASCALPVVASNLEGITDAIIDGQNGVLVESENAQAFAKKINLLLQNENARKEFGQKSRQFTIQNFAWQKIAQKYLDRFSEIAPK